MEDGNDDFLYIWDLLNCQRALQLEEFQKIDNNSRLEEDLIEKCHKKLKMRRVCALFILYLL